MSATRPTFRTAQVHNLNGLWSLGLLVAVTSWSFAHDAWGQRISRHRGDSSAPRMACPDGMNRVPGGPFQMGLSPERGGAEDENPHLVIVTDYCLDRTEVTVADYIRCVDAGTCPRLTRRSFVPGNRRTDGEYDDSPDELNSLCNGPEDPNHPVNCVTWHMARSYCAWRGARLPTEAEWEHAAGAQYHMRYPWGDRPLTRRHLNICGPECVGRVPGTDGNVPLFRESDEWESTAPVGSFPAGRSINGILDLAGNVSEWVEDGYQRVFSSNLRPSLNPVVEGAFPIHDPSGTRTNPDYRVYRGSSFSASSIDMLRPSLRLFYISILQDPMVGFRCAAEVLIPRRSRYVDFDQTRIPDVVARVIAQRTPELERCYVPSASVTTSGVHNVQASIVIGQQGEVRRHHRNPYISDEQACVDNVVQHWTFPEWRRLCRLGACNEDGERDFNITFRIQPSGSSQLGGATDTGAPTNSVASSATVVLERTGPIGVTADRSSGEGPAPSQCPMTEMMLSRLRSVDLAQAIRCRPEAQRVCTLREMSVAPEVSASIRIATTGLVESVEINSRYQDPEVGRCIEGLFRGRLFPNTTGSSCAVQHDFPLCPFQRGEIPCSWVRRGDNTASTGIDGGTSAILCMDSIEFP